MPAFLDTADDDFDDRLATLLAGKREGSVEVEAAVDAIIADVRARGDDALVALSAQFDAVDLTPETFAFTGGEMAAAEAAVDPDDLAALRLAAERIRAYHAQQMPADAHWTDAAGVGLGWRWHAIDAVGLYVPGGQAAYPSSVLMTAIPARVAGVRRLEMCVPTPKGAVDPLVLAAARIAGVDRVWKLGGAQAIAAMAYGTATIPAVDKIAGPGNAWVAAAKRRVFGRVGIDMVAGPSEILVVADADNEPDWIALDLLSQAEHDESAQSILITDDASFGHAVAEAVAARLTALDRAEVAGASWRDNGAIITVADLDEAAMLADRIAPEHLHLCVAHPEPLSQAIANAGAIFLGAWTPEAIGDYVGGPSHVLPTARSARFSSGLSVMDFLKRTTTARATSASLREIGPAAERLARAEGLEAHGLSVRARLDKLNRAAE